MPAAEQLVTQLKETNRHLRNMDDNLSKIAKALMTLNSNYVEINRRPNDVVTKET